MAGAQEDITLLPAPEAIGAGSNTGKHFPFLVGCTALELPSSITPDTQKVCLP